METAIIVGLAALAFLAATYAQIAHGGCKAAIAQKEGIASVNQRQTAIIALLESEKKTLEARLATARAEANFWEGVSKEFTEGAMKIASGRGGA